MLGKGYGRQEAGAEKDTFQGNDKAGCLEQSLAKGRLKVHFYSSDTPGAATPYQAEFAQELEKIKCIKLSVVSKTGGQRTT